MFDKQIDERNIATRQFETDLAGGSWTWGKYYYFSLYLFTVTEDEALFPKDEWHATVVQHWKDENRTIKSDQALHVAHKTFHPLCTRIFEYISVRLLNKEDILGKPEWRNEIMSELVKLEVDKVNIVKHFKEVLEDISKRQPYSTSRCVKLVFVR